MSLISTLLLQSALLLLLSSSLSMAKVREEHEWDRRVIYQLLTDRFSQSPGMDEKCPDLHDWCGGTFKGIESKLDYLEALGVNALWISPFVLQVPARNYHGYAAKDLYKVDPHFGSEQDLRDFIDSAHKRDIWVMLDVVPNHMGLQPNCLSAENCDDPLDFSGFVPFDSPEHYHELCVLNDYTNQTEVEVCRLFFLPDLNQSNDFVSEIWTNWIQDMNDDFDFDGYRLDTARHMAKQFLATFKKAAGNIVIGEVFSYDLEYVASYQESLGSVLNFPQEGALKETFLGLITMHQLKDRLLRQREAFRGGRTATFLDNHDIPRFLADKSVNQLHNALMIHLFWDGIPIIYYGTEQAFKGASSEHLDASRIFDAGREPLWPHYDTFSETFVLISKALETREKLVNQGLFDRNQEANIVYTDDNTIAITRGSPIEVLAISLYDGDVSGSWSVIIERVDLGPGTELRNVLSDETVVVDANNNIVVQFDFPYKPKLFVPLQEE